ncbi:Predicted Fe-Mo cluster-binding protein, NifX family [Desulfonispora thiosulfatigenes DSM 11270]|uniref:Predicted Fe-Mo cluster-binding protein, NifX family n=1 Tax=Desulfonispora thiosulfatigenes DSM 11270 TaxID=656914 RepID=A0A1W1V458_DESTI|nr:NifB/NifX family molybdenum-iron cluster-binding protein [Desulfonispora thiosulfatigenes]SMB88043.1 Predicted Fe-Mo cluster-binding protein, NifX family [Desulfonispora thiosulfatigenes DSM 11270]
MKIAISTSGTTLEADLDKRFGRAEKFVIYDLEKDTFEVIDNTQNLNLPQGAGIQAGKTIAGSGAGAIITGHVGPKAYTTLNSADIDIYFAEGGTIKSLVEDFKNNKLTKAEGPDKEGHWS